MIDKLCDCIINNEKFSIDYEVLSKCSSLISLREKIDIDSEILYRLLKTATIFALSDNDDNRKKAYSIAVMSRNILSHFYGINRKEIEALIVIVLSRLGNFPAENKFIEEVVFDNSILPHTLQIERQYHIQRNEAPLLEKQVVFTDFQHDLWEAVQTHKVVIVNAPTSAGKSFVLQNYVIDATLVGHLNYAVYIVPSRALIEQVIISLRAVVQDNPKAKEQIHITEVPQDYGETKKKVIYVLTQERAQILLESSISIDLVVIDEAQNIADGARGIILQSVVERILKRKITPRFIFAMPYVKNPDEFLSVFNLGGDYAIVPSAESPVKQNLYNVLVDAHMTHKVTIEQINDQGNRKYLFDTESEVELADEQRYLAVLSVVLGKHQNNIVFGSEPSQCERIAGLIIQLIEKKEDSELLAFSEFIKEHIHNDYLLAESILYGVAYHYGVLPSFLRKEIERLAAKGKINYIVCTSTLLQGVNLPAQNIFIMKPSKGRAEKNKPGLMEPSEFWNLVGRAGRLTKDYEGNVFLINVQNWERQYVNEKDRYQPVYSAYQSTISRFDAELLDFISNSGHPSGLGGNQGFENSFMKLLDVYMGGGKKELSESLHYVCDAAKKETIIDRIEKASDLINLPRELLMKNPNISAYRQQEMVDYLKKRIMEKGVMYLIPPHPLQRWESIKESYIRLFNRFGKYFKKAERTNYMAIDALLALKWMRGSSYSELLRSQIRYRKENKKQRRDPNVNTEARNLFKKIDTSLRFEYVKFTKCYNDLLCYVMREFKIEESVAKIPPLNLYLELGACSGTSISLMGLGISRTSAAILTSYATKTSMNEDEVLLWLKKNNLVSMGVPDTVIYEVNRALGL